jgi:hypothetical protein
MDYSRFGFIVARLAVSFLCLGTWLSFEYVLSFSKKAEWLLYSVSAPIKVLAYVGVLQLIFIPIGLWLWAKREGIELVLNILTFAASLYFVIRVGFYVYS